MRATGILLLIVLSVSTSLQGPAANANEGDPEIVILRDSALLRAARGLDISPLGNLVVETRDNLYDVGAGRFLLASPAPHLEGFAFMADSSLLVINGGKLGYYQRGALHDAEELPGKGFRLAGESGTSGYVWGGTGRAAGIYRIGKGGRHLRVLDLEDITALTAFRGRLFFAVEGALLTVASGERLSVLYKDPKLRILSVAVEPWTGTVLFSTADAVYGIKKGKAARLLAGLGGYLKMGPDELYVLSPSRGVVVKLQSPRRALQDD